MSCMVDKIMMSCRSSTVLIIFLLLLSMHKGIGTIGFVQLAFLAG